MKTRRHAFTLIELLTVIAIIGILAAILIPTISKVRRTARDTRDLANLRNTGAGILNYFNDVGRGSVKASDLRNQVTMAPYFGGEQGFRRAYYSETWMDTVGRQNGDQPFPIAYTVNAIIWPANGSDTTPIPTSRIMAQANKPLFFTGVRFSGFGAYQYGFLGHVNPIYSGVNLTTPNFTPTAYPEAKALVLFVNGSTRLVNFARDNQDIWWTRSTN